MPRYGYNCPACGRFDEMRSMAAYAEPCCCPTCGVSAPREMAAARIGAGASPMPIGAKTPPRRHRSGCGCCTPPLGKTMRAEAMAAGAPRRGPVPSPASFLTRE